MVEKQYADTVLLNARVLTMEPANPEAWFVAVKGDKIIGAGDAEDARQFKGPHTREVDCQGMALIPGFNDAHCHLLALASSLRGVDCRPDKVRSIPHVVKAISRHAGSSQQGEWIRAFGYDEFYLVEKRHPTRRDLDVAAPFHPVRLDHRTGHAAVLNSIALDLLRISRDTADPIDGVIERDAATGEPTGVLFEMGDYIGRAVRAHRTYPEGNRIDGDAFLEGIRRVDRLLLSKGITSVQDAGPGNDYDRWQTLHKLTEEGALRPRVTMMAGASHLQSFLDAGLIPGSGDDGLRLGAVKIMLTLTTGLLRPHREELEHLVLMAHGRGYQLAIHAVEQEAVEAAVDVLVKAQTVLPSPDTRHRIEHCSECPPGLVEKLKNSRALVVTQPSFIYHNGQKYLSEVEEGLQPDLYPVWALMEAGIPVAACSDAPVTQPDPILGIYSAVTRKTRDGSTVSLPQSITVGDALKMHTINGAHASFEEGKKGSIAAGKLADLALLDGDPTALELEAIKEIEVMMTMVGGEVVWQG